MSRLAAALTVGWRSLVESPSAIGGEISAQDDSIRTDGNRRLQTFRYR
jgi:hypothetical protein